MELQPETLVSRAVITFQNRIPDIIMDALVSIVPDTVHVAADPFGFLAVRALTLLILLLLLGLAARATLHFPRHSDIPLPRLRCKS